MATSEVTLEEFKAIVTFKITDYGPAVLVEVYPTGKHCSIRKDAIVLDGPTFRQGQEQHNGATSWVIGSKEACRVVTPEYYKHYTDGNLIHRPWYCNEKRKRNAEDPSVALSNGDFHLAVRPGDCDRNFYGLDGRAIPHAIWVDHIFGHLKGTPAEMEVAAEKLSADDQVTKIDVSEIFHMNADFEGQHGIEFLFTPTDEQFAMWGPGSEGHDFHAMYATIRSLVGLGEKC